ncbi:ABC transporter permease [Jatrophihabitans sp. YIM 134969]
MTAVALPVAGTRRTPLRSTYRFEVAKLASQWRTRALLVVCWLGPGLFVAVVGQQSALPADTVFGRWMSQTGWAGPLVVLAFCCNWVLPVLTSLVAGDVFAVEDRLGTWRHLLVAVRSPRRIFAAKALASLTVLGALVLGLAVSGIVGGLLAVGDHPLVALDGRSLATGDTFRLVVLAWVVALAPTLAFAAVGLLGSVLFGRSPMGLVTPALLALLLDVAQVLPLPTVVRIALPSYGFLAWRGLFTEPVQTTTIVVGVLVALVWAVVATLVARLVFLRRGFTGDAHDGVGRRGVLTAVVPLAAVLALSAGVVAVATPATGSGVERPVVERSLSTAFGHLYRLQAAQLHRPDVTEADLATTAACDKGGSLVEDHGPGNDWRCVVTWHIPGATATGTATYQLDVKPDGRYIADGDGPREVNGFFLVRTGSGDTPNPLWQFDGLVDLTRPSKG